MIDSAKRFRVAFVTLGCKTNRYDAATVRNRLNKDDFVEVPFTSIADAYVVFTCTVTHIADRQSRQFIYQAHKRNLEAAIVVAGCYPVVASEEALLLEGVTHVIDSPESDRVLEVLYKLAKSSHGFTPESEFALTRFEDRSRPFLKIQDGCDNFCSYCIIPYTRGAPRSIDADTILKRLEALAKSGYKEVVLSGITMGKWGVGLPGKQNFAGLLERIDKEALIPRIRVSSVEPVDLTEEVIDIIAESKTICEHLHIPLQSGCDSVLNRMNRPYETALYRERFKYASRRIANLCWGADVIVGFPGESEEEFEETYSFLESFGWQYLHVFPYSIRKGTPAATMPEQVPPQTSKARAARLRDLSNKRKVQAAHDAIGQNLEVLVEVPAKAGSAARCQSRNYFTVWIDNSSLEKNQVVSTRIKDVYNSTELLGETEQG